MVRHEAVGVKLHAVTVFIFQKEVVVELLGRVGFEEPGLVMALPSDVESAMIFEDGVSGKRRHELSGGKS